MTKAELKKTPLYDLHKSNNARMVPFADYDMPVHYSLGIKYEHLHTREKAGLFDVSHMGQMQLTGKNAGAVMEALTPADIIDLPFGKQRYTLFNTVDGGILDDLMITRYDDCLYLVVNAACITQDINHIRTHLTDGVQLKLLEDRALIALQGPLAASILQPLAPDISSMSFMDSKKLKIADSNCFVSRSGYTGEDGFEISIPANDAERITQLLLNHPDVQLIGLGARDSLRLEAGLCLYGHDMDTKTTLAEANLSWVVSKIRRTGNPRAGGFLGAEKVLEQIDNKSFTRKRTGLIGKSQAPVREGTEIVNIEKRVIGRVTSGTFSPTIGAPIAMALLDTNYTEPGTEVFAVVRGTARVMTVTKMPFITQRYHRG